jgi:anti-sigma B factor antagonist
MTDPGSGASAGFVRSDQARGRTLTIEGEIDLAVDSEMRSELRALIAEAHSPAFVDLSGVTFMGATGVGALIVARTDGAVAGHPLVLVGASRSCRRVLHASGVAGQFAFVE